jgi:hypothetical protein
MGPGRSLPVRTSTRRQIDRTVIVAYCKSNWHVLLVVAATVVGTTFFAPVAAEARKA